MAILEEYDWMLINELSFKIHTTSDTKEMRQTVLTCLNQIISFDMASFFLLSDAGPDFNYSDPVFYCFSDLDLQIYKNCGEQIDFTKWLFYNRKNAAYKESDLRSPDKLKDTEIYQQCYLPLNIKYVARMFLVYHSRLSGLLTLYKKSNEDFSDKDLYILNQLQDHLSFRLLDDSSDFGIHAKFDDKQKRIIAKYGLTDREIEVYLLTVKGLDNNAIAEKMCISPNTLKKHYSSIYSKMKISSRIQLLQISNII